MAAHFTQQKTRNTFGAKSFGVLAGVTINILLAAGTSLAGSTEDANYKYVPLAIESKLYGTIKKLPAGHVGTWIVNSREILITGKTKISEEYGKAEITHRLIFERFYRTAAVRGTEGSGLGLSIVKSIVEAHDGEISVISEPGNWSRFTLTLPSA